MYLDSIQNSFYDILHCCHHLLVLGIHPLQHHLIRPADEVGQALVHSAVAGWDCRTAQQERQQLRKKKKEQKEILEMLSNVKEWVSHCAFHCFALWHSEFVLSRWQSSGFSSSAAALPFSSTKWWQSEGTNHQQLTPRYQKELSGMQVNTAMLKITFFPT